MGFKVSGKVFLVAALTVAIGIAIAIYSMNRKQDFSDGKAVELKIQYYPAIVFRFIDTDKIEKHPRVCNVRVTTIEGPDEIGKEVELSLQLSSEIDINLNWLEEYRKIPLKKRAEGIAIIFGQKGANHDGELLGFPTAVASGKNISFRELVLVTALKSWCAGATNLIVPEEEFDRLNCLGFKVVQKGGGIHFVALR